VTILINPRQRDLDKLIKLLGMLGSAYPNERDVAAVKATELLRSLNLSWEDVINPSPKLLGGPKQNKSLAAKLSLIRANADLLSDWERKFVASLSRFRRLSPKQHAVIDRLVDVINAERQAA
jgi:hypothetical protein